MKRDPPIRDFPEEISKLKAKSKQVNPALTVLAKLSPITPFESPENRIDKNVIDRLASQATASKTAPTIQPLAMQRAFKAKTPRVGIFWLVESRLLFDSTPLHEAEVYGECKNHQLGHVDRWRQLQITGKVSCDVEYEELPRGRVVYNTRTDQFLLLADGCILKRSNLIKKIMDELQLPPHKTKRRTDPHYRCFSCLKRRYSRTCN